MKIKVLFLYSKMLSFLLMLLGVSSCISRAEYGSPEALYKIKGKVIDKETKKAIPGIQIVFEKTEGEFIGRMDTLFSDNSGEFLYARHTSFAEEVSHLIKFQDIDSITNGEYLEAEKTVQIKKSDYVGGDGDWNDGTATKDLGSIELIPKIDNE